MTLQIGLNINTTSMFLVVSVHFTNETFYHRLNSALYFGDECSIKFLVFLPKSVIYV